METTTFIVVVAWSAFVVATAMLLGRRLNRVHRAGAAVATVGVLAVLPTLLLGTFGIPLSLPLWSLGLLLKLGYAGVGAEVVGAAAWIAADTAFVWAHRREAFPFAFRGTPGGDR